MDLGFCFQDLGDGGDSFIKSFIEPSGHAYQDAMLEDLVSAQHGSHLSLSEDSGWDASFLHPSATPYGSTAHHRNHHYSHATSSSFAASSPSPASSSPSGRSSPAGSSLMALADYDEGGLLIGGGVHAGAAAAMGSMPPLGLSYFDLQAMGPMDMPDALGLYGLGGASSSSFNALDSPLMSAPPPAAAHRGGGARHVLNPVKQEHGHHFPYHHHHQQQHQHHQQGALPASAPSKAGAGVPGMWSPPLDEPVQRKRKLAASRRPTLAGAVSASDTIAEASTGCEQQKGGGGSSKAGDLYELPLAVELAGALVGHRGVAVKLEERPEATTNAKHHQQQQQQQQQYGGKRQQQQQGEPVELVVERQPPVEVRTRTPSENRNFGVTVRITGHHDTPLPIQSVEVRLAYASSPEDVVRAHPSFFLFLSLSFSLLPRTPLQPHWCTHNPLTLRRSHGTTRRAHTRTHTHRTSRSWAGRRRCR
jgi:hypothetical protein